MLALAQPAPVGGLKQDLIVPTVQQAVVSPRWRGQGVGWGGGRDGPPDPEPRVAAAETMRRKI